MKELTIKNLKAFIKDYLKGYSPMSDNPYDQGVLDVLKDLEFEFLYKKTTEQEIG